MGLVGPPPVYNQTQPKDTTTDDPFLDLMLTNFNYLAALSSFVADHSSSSDLCLDFFFHITPQTLPRSLIKKVNLIWDRDPQTALKLILNLRDIRANGKSNDEGFFTAAFWLHRKHPNTLASNIAFVAELNCFK